MQRAVACPEVVDTDVYADVLEPLQLLERLFLVESHALGNFKIDKAGIKSDLFQELLDLTCQIGLHKLAQTQVD
ncbi:hypothetical protein D3C71_1271990 [compost metagenome]